MKDYTFFVVSLVVLLLLTCMLNFVVVMPYFSVYKLLIKTKQTINSFAKTNQS